MNRYHLLQLFYWFCVLATCVVAYWRGRTAERQGAAILTAGSLATMWAAEVFGRNFEAAQFAVLFVDMLVLAGFLFLVLQTERFWPLWVCGLHLVGVATHLAVLFYPAILPQAYRVVRGFWAYPMMVIIIFGALGSWKLKLTNDRA